MRSWCAYILLNCLDSQPGIAHSDRKAARQFHQSTRSCDQDVWWRRIGNGRVLWMLWNRYGTKTEGRCRTDWVVADVQTWMRLRVDSWINSNHIVYRLSHELVRTNIFRTHFSHELNRINDCEKQLSRKLNTKLLWWNKGGIQMDLIWERSLEYK